MGGSRMTLRTVVSGQVERRRGERSEGRGSASSVELTTVPVVVLAPSMAGFLLFIFKTSFFRKLPKNNNGADLRE